MDGNPGVLMTFAAQRSGVEFSYMAAVYIKGGKVLIAEAGGKSETFAPRMPELRKAIFGVRAGGL